MDIKLRIQSTEKPAYKTREERAIEQRDRLLDKMEYAYDCLQAGIREEQALKCLRTCWAWLESIDDLPGHLQAVKEYVTPIIREIGAEDENSNME